MASSCSPSVTHARKTIHAFALTAPNYIYVMEFRRASKNRPDGLVSGWVRTKSNPTCVLFGALKNRGRWQCCKLIKTAFWVKFGRHDNVSTTVTVHNLQEINDWIFNPDLEKFECDPMPQVDSWQIAYRQMNTCVWHQGPPMSTSLRLPRIELASNSRRKISNLGSMCCTT